MVKPRYSFFLSLFAHTSSKKKKENVGQKESKKGFFLSFARDPATTTKKLRSQRSPFFFEERKKKCPCYQLSKKLGQEGIFCQCEDGKRIMLFCNLEKNSCNLLMRKKNSNCNLANLKIQNEGGFLWSDWIFEILWDSQSLSFPFVFKAQSKVGVFFVRLIIFVSLGKTKKSVFLRWKATKFCFESTKESFTMRW